ncbi:hypothetical protein P171DRAFT_442713 [Karstenula rhodostoma CBS 690.94]|uniref:Uncharacterized protein n=1 Tax=Karstenula rhodostoma CBS 690.94 TaxID=1392251 RepID=A0A9P4PNC1_9PLEO|nr:hypothetical protein P171DRAFT_442713 [Karstenula rhodostoma CBS 690.94]
MSTMDPVDDAIENVTTLANCWLTLLPNFDCGTTGIRVAEVVNEITCEISDDLAGYDLVAEAEYHTRMLRASFLLRDWLKFEHHAKPIIDLGFSNLRLAVNVADLKDPAKKYKYRTPMRLSPAVQELKSKGIVFKTPFGHLMARCLNLETSPIDKTAVATGEIELDEEGKFARFEHPVDLRRHILRGRSKFKKALTDYIKAAFGEERKQMDEPQQE